MAPVLDQPASAEERLAVGRVARQEQVFRQLHARCGAMAEPLLRHEGRAEQAAAGDR